MTAAQIAAYDYNQTLKDQIAAATAAAQAQQAAAQAAQQAADQQKQAADALTSAWQSATDSIMGEVERIQGIMGTTPQSMASAEAQFAIYTAQARSGDIEAAKLLPNLSKTILDMETAAATNALDVQRMQSQMIGSLETTAGFAATNFGVTVTSDPALLAEIQALRAEVSSLRSSMDKTAANTLAQESFLRRISPDGNSITVTVAP